MRFAVRVAYLLHHRNYCESYLTSKRCPDSIKGSKRGLGSRLSLCADRLISEMNHLQRTELFRKMIIRCQEQKLHETLLDILAFLFRRDYRITMVDADNTNYWMHALNGLLTYNGPFGIIDSRCYKGLLMHPQLLCKALRNNAIVISLFNDLKALALEAKEKFFLAHVSIAIELCENTLLLEMLIRVHGHLMLEGGFGRKINIQDPSVLAFRGQLPIKSSATLLAAIGTMSHRSVAAGHYYLLSPKLSGILAWGTCKPFVHFRVNPDHIMAFVQSEKKSPDAAKMEILKTYKDT